MLKIKEEKCSKCCLDNANILRTICLIDDAYQIFIQLFLLFVHYYEVECTWRDNRTKSSNSIKMSIFVLFYLKFVYVADDIVENELVDYRLKLKYC